MTIGTDNNFVDVADVADTSDVNAENVEPQDSDNSTEQTQEPENNEQSTKDGEQQQENQEQGTEAAQKPKFDNLEAALKGYENLEKKLGEQSSELGELRKSKERLDELEKQFNEKKLKEANENGFNTVKEFENHKEVVKAEADAYAKRIKDCEFPDEMVKLLAEYRRNPSDELRKTIESQFSTDSLKEVAGEMAILKGQLQFKEQEALQKELENSARAYLDENVAKYQEDFKSPAFAALYGEAFRAYGCDLQSDKFVELMHQYRDEVLKSANIETNIDDENNSATDEIEGLTNTGSGASSFDTSGSLLDMDEKDMRAAIRKLI